MQSNLRQDKNPDSTDSQFVLRNLRSASLFSNLSNDELVCFENVSQIRSYKKGKVLYVEEELAEYFYVICSGWVKLFHSMDSGEEVIVDMLTSGYTVGESAIFEKGFHTSSAQVVEDVILICIPSSTLKMQIFNSSHFASAMLASMSRHHRRHYGEIALNAMQDAPQRIGCFLLRLCPIGKNKDIVLQLPYDKTLIAVILGMKGATFSRALNTLREKTNMRITSTSVEIDSVDKLAKFVYGPLAKKYSPENL